jgi:hypothetical protein
LGKEGDVEITEIPDISMLAFPTRRNSRLLDDGIRDGTERKIHDERGK